MKKLYAGVLILSGACGASYANPGDTTLVPAHNEVQMPNYGNYDNPVTFPDGSISYQKIVMEYTLGKYNCGNGYNPSNPGEGAGQTGWCADWDYDVHIIACNAAGDTLEMGEMITPYANTTFPLFPWTWKQSYYYDVTDFYPVLKNAATIRVFYSGYSGGFTSTIKFHFIEGTPPRNVIKISKLWHGGFAYGNTGDPIESKVAEKTESFPATAVTAETKLIITGHGGDNTENCSEFCKKWYKYMINDVMVEQRDIWRDNCGANFVSPQSGTWPIDRANWCPGAQVNTIIHKVPAIVTPGQNFTVDMDFQSYTSGNNGASYKLSAIMFYYGNFNRALDAGIERVISPNKVSDFVRENPVCGSPELAVKNYGSTTLTSIEFEYGVEGTTLSTYTWSTSLASLAEANVTLPQLATLNEATSGGSRFIVRILKVNNATDENVYNNEMKTDFVYSPVWNGGQFAISFKVPGAAPFGAGENITTWKIYDISSGALVTQRSSAGVTPGTVLNDTLHMGNGCYKLVVDCDKGYGTSFFSYINPRGYVRVYDLANGNKMPVPNSDLGASGLEGNFGNGFKQYFRVVNSTSSVHDLNKMAYTLNVYPNPATDMIHIDVIGTLRQEAKIQLVNVVGQTVYTLTTQKQNISIPTTGLPNGIYTLVYNAGDSRKTEKVVIHK